jgi:NAD(P)-dependent dehydrogenase (short-subunit alcohol dehydrogenase family)
MNDNRTGRLAGKVALVAGAGCVGPGWGNGRAIATRFAQEGARVFAVDKDLQAMEETLVRVREAGGEATPYACDVTDTAAVAAMVAACLAHYGRIDVLVNNVGAPIPGGPVRLSEEQWQSQLDLNLSTVFLTCKHVIPVMEAQGSGAIVNVASTSGIRWTGAAQVGYAVAKAGVIQFARVVGVEYAKKGIRINTVVPGQLHTPLVDAFLAKDQTGGDIDGLLKRRQARIPMPFAGDGRDTANAALFLASEEARFVTGTEIVVDGGMSARCD